MIVNSKLKEYEQYLRNHDKADLTIESYLSDIQLFLNYIKNKKSFTDYNTELITYKNYLLHSKIVKVKTVNRKIISIRMFLKWAKYSTTIKLEKVQSQNFLDGILNDEEVKQIIQQCELQNDLRAKALILTLFYTGTRISECLQIGIDDIDKDFINVIGKGKKHRTIFIPKKLKEVWWQYKQVRIDKSDKLFTGQKGGINRTTAHSIIKKYGALANIDFEKCHAHILRHLFAKSLVEKGLSLDVVASFLGHSSLQTTMIYTKKTRNELLDIINKF